jgi:putative sterol carrier protein
MSGKLKLKGDILHMIRHVKAAKALVNVAGTVDTQILDDQI